MRTLGTEFPLGERMASTFVKPTPWHTIVGDSIELRLRQCEIELETWLLSWNTIIYFLAHGNFPLHCLILQHCQKGPQKNWTNCRCWKLNQRCIKRSSKLSNFTFRVCIKKEIVAQCPCVIGQYWWHDQSCLFATKMSSYVIFGSGKRGS